MKLKKFGAVLLSALMLFTTGAAGGCAMSSLMQGTLWLAARNNP